MVYPRKPKHIGGRGKDHCRWEADFDYRVSSRAVWGRGVK